eukprot:6166293-Pyramimonas_sp.AAC.1
MAAPIAHCGTCATTQSCATDGTSETLHYGSPDCGTCATSQSWAPDDAGETLHHSSSTGSTHVILVFSEHRLWLLVRPYYAPTVLLSEARPQAHTHTQPHMRTPAVPHA